MDTLVVASSNKHKIEEISKVTKKFGIDVISRDEAGIPKDIKIHILKLNQLWTSVARLP